LISLWRSTSFDTRRRIYTGDTYLPRSDRQKCDTFTDGAADDGAHSQNEKIDRKNYIEGTKVLASYIYQISKL